MLEVPVIVRRPLSIASARVACAPAAERAPTHPASARPVRRAERTCLRAITVPFECGSTSTRNADSKGNGRADSWRGDLLRNSAIGRVAASADGDYFVRREFSPVVTPAGGVAHRSHMLDQPLHDGQPRPVPRRVW